MTLSVAVVGAGLAGLICARHLAAGGSAVTLFEKSRGLGGRLATRRVGQSLSFDHGAQFITARGAAFRALLQDLEAAGALAVWRPQIVGAKAGRRNTTWWVGTPGMTALFRPLAEGLELRLATRVLAVTEGAEGLRLGLEGDEAAGPFDRLVLAIPQIQAAELLAGRPEADALASVRVAPCWTAMLAFAEPLKTGFDVRQADDGLLSWIARNASKPGRDPAAETWVLQADPDWSAAHLEQEGSEVLAELTSTFAAVAGPLPAAIHATAHRWRYARTVTPLGRPFLGEDRILVGGDWCLGARAEAAYDSGLAMAEAILGKGP
ncbi:NAD(P)/FAD-dependent oxidoreductase [Algihabitans albus]|uniref:NAD(P)/FAD-dependent oxidoreductase n=1 Tax=Algihabitans albus TaxID=2164067 RepID=UPI000E5C7D6D|nr:FAD-dependent oxidoreductase [Algihabitans albus]